MSKNTTKQKIISAAEQLFATRGYAETSMREITAKANVNLASVNYHYGSKKQLMQAVIDKYLAEFFPTLLSTFDELPNDNLNAKQLLLCFKVPLLELNRSYHNGGVYFMQLIARGYIDVQGHLRSFIVDKYGKQLNVIVDKFVALSPSSDKATVFWQLHFALGTVAFTLSASKALTEIALSDFNEVNNFETLVDKLIVFLAQGLDS